jgi:steroid Delta-isomerase
LDQLCLFTNKAMTAQTSVSPDVIQATISQYFTAIRSTDVDSWLKTFAEDAVSYEPVGTEPLQGKAAIRIFFESIAGLFATVELTPEFVHITGNEAVIKWTGRGVGRNDRAVEFEGINLVEFNDSGKIQALRGYWNPAKMMAELRS